MKKQKSGVSLIVLVITIIVIIILAVAVILSIANNNPIENAKEARIKSDLKAIEEELTLKQASNYVDEHANNKTPSEITIKDLASAANYEDKLTIKDGKLCVTSNASEEERKVAKDLGMEVIKSITLKVGDEITYQNEPFYVIGGDEVGTEVTDDTQNILLLAKYNLKEDGTLKQDTSGASNTCAFSSTNYWSTVEGIAYPYDDGKYPDLNDLEKYPIPSGETSIVKMAKEYGNSLGVTGRLMTYEEAGALKKVDSTILYKNKLTYWLSSARDGSTLLYVYANLEKDFGDYGICVYSKIDCSGVRPVIKVSASSIK